MSKRKRSIVIYEDWTITIKALPAEIKCDVVDALFTYGFTGELPEVSEVALAIIKPWCAVIDENNVKYQAKADNMATNRNKKSDRNQSEIRQKSDRNQPEIESDNDNDNVYVNDNDNVNDNDTVSPSEIIVHTSKQAEDVISQYNTICLSLPKVTKLTERRKRAIRARLKDYTIDEIISVFEKAEASDFLTGRIKEWKANFDWLMKPENFVKVIEDTYINKGNAISNRYDVADRWLAERMAVND